MATEIFIDISIILILAVVISAIMRVFKQPLLIGYILTGIIAGPYLLNILNPDSMVVFQTLSKIGVALLLFIVGLHLNLRVIKDVGKVSLLTGIGQVLFTSIVGFFLIRLFGFSVISSIYIAVALTFSSTIIIMKLLSDTNQLETLHGKIAIGFLIVQDLVAIFALIIISSLSNGTSISTLVFGALLKGSIAIVLIFLFSYLFLPRLTKIISNSQEFLFLFSISWCFALASLFNYLNFSFEIGALIAGVTLSFSPYYQEISSKTKPLRDFFIVLFFILLGSQLVLGDVSNRILEIVVLSAFILIGNPIIVMIIMGIMGYKKRTSFLAGLTVAQISEFSLILIALGITVGHLPKEILSLVTTVGLITIAGSTYMILYSNKLYFWLSRYLSIFEKKKLNNKREHYVKYDAILFGYNRIGFNILNALKHLKKKSLVIDFNPDTIADLQKLRVPSLYGDVYDSEFLSELPLNKLQLAISTIPEFETNILLIESIKKVNPNAIIIVRAHEVSEALELYKQGATYVLTPHFLGGEYVAKMIREEKLDIQGYLDEKEKHVRMLKTMLNRGIKHPEVERD